MAYFAKIDGNIVTEVVVAAKAPYGEWVETFIDGGPRMNYAGVGFTYDETADAFVPPKPFASWMLDTSTYTWEAPVPKPSSGDWRWDEEAEEWIEL